MLEELEQSKPLSDLEDTDASKLSDSQQSYLEELHVPSEDWTAMSDMQKDFQLDLIQERCDEIGVKEVDSLRGKNLLSPEILDELNIRLEAPNDMVQIEQISEVLANCEEIKYENWQNLELNEKVDLLNDLESQIARIEHRPACPISAVDLRSDLWGGYNQWSKSIDINSDYLEASGNDWDIYREVLDTLVHEGRHAYQDYNINVREVHPRHSEVSSWAETMGDGKWEYWNDCSTELGQRLYEQQSIEIDARNFAADVLERMDVKSQS